MKDYTAIIRISVYYEATFTDKEMFEAGYKDPDEFIQDLDTDDLDYAWDKRSQEREVVSLEIINSATGD